MAHGSPHLTPHDKHQPAPRNTSVMESNRMRKIEVQSPEDIRFLIEGFSRAVRRKIDLHLPPEAVNRDDELRKGVDSAVIEFVHRMFGLARHSIAVNGMDAGPVESYLKKDEAEEFEPYDRKLHDRMKALYAELESETVRVSELRREAPARAAMVFEAGLIKEFESDERILAEIAKKIEVGEKAGDLGIKPLERKQDTEAEYSRSAEILKELQTALPAIAHKLTRAQDALDYVQSKQ